MISRLMTHTAILLLLLSCGSACKSSQEGKQQQSKSAQQQDTTPTPQRAQAEQLGKESLAVEESQAKDLVEKWLLAQNSVAFDGYAALYAQRFSGIKKVGAQSFRMDRKTWLADRKPMFKKGLQVQARDLQVTPGASTALVRFEQHWASGSYEDRGPKAMTLVMEEGQVRIAREEMLESHVMGDPGSDDEYPVFLVYQVGGATYAVIGEGASSRELSFIEVEGGYNAIGPADLSKHPEMRAWQGRQIRVFDNLGNSCETVTGKVVSLSRALPHFSVGTQWEKDGASKSARAQTIFDHSKAQFAVEVEPPDPKCDQIHLAQLISQKAPRVATLFFDDQLQNQALQAFGRAPVVKKVAKAHEKEAPRTSAKIWTEESLVRQSIRLFQFKETGQRYAWVSVHTGNGCGGWEGGAALLFKILPGETPRFEAMGSDAEYNFPWGDMTMLLDAHHNGKLQFVHHSSIGSDLKLFGAPATELKEVRFSNWDCSC